MAVSQGPVYLCRHGATLWTETGQHTGVTDLSLTQNGRSQASALARRLCGFSFAHVLSSPRRRALETCDALSLRDQVQIWPELSEWDYGQYEGLTSDQIRLQVPKWTIFTHGAAGGESLDAITDRVDQVIERLEVLEGSVILFSHGHFLRALGARWIGLSVESGAHLDLGPAALSILGYVHESRALLVWNETWFQHA